MHTLYQLQSGQLKGAKHLKLSCGLQTFPNEIFDLADSLEILDLSGNELSNLPEDFARLQNLRILFLSQNKFSSFPTVLTGCVRLEMIGFKNNQISLIPENSIPTYTRWLILTDNEISDLPKSIGNCPRLQKVMFAGNKLSKLPEEMAHCVNIELLRLSANQFCSFPDWLFDLPKLSWLALAGNPCTEESAAQKPNVQQIDWKQLTIKEKLGEGASGITSKALWKKNDGSEEMVAVKLFKGAVTSDGWAADEMAACTSLKPHPHLVQVLGVLSHHPEHKTGLVFSLIPPSYKNLGLPPTFDSCTRDVFPPNSIFTPQQLCKIASQMASVAKHLHDSNINHGDLYAHNTLIDEQSNILFGDFGAAFNYSHMPKSQAGKLEKVEVRAFGSFVDDLLNTLDTSIDEDILVKALKHVRDQCFQADVLARPRFEDLVKKLKSLVD
jgi:hypothetical protein